MPTTDQLQEGKGQQCIVVRNEIKETVGKAAKTLNMSISEVYEQGAMTYLNNGRRPISKEEIFARDILANLPDDKWVYLAATADFLRGSVDQAKYSMLRTLLGKFLKNRSDAAKNSERSEQNLRAITA